MPKKKSPKIEYIAIGYIWLHRREKLQEILEGKAWDSLIKDTPERAHDINPSVLNGKQQYSGGIFLLVDRKLMWEVFL